ncbi:MAG: acetyl-CoA carboxylase biotin carboxyl carrier protein [Candidatus Omnitrophica bacterium]|nr:acetyl-CoA carboxylase biotin carboxyl carrier protein [Candidatus Omnitrophota bacterium]
MNLKEVKDLIDLMNKNKLEEVNIEEGDLKIYLRKKGKKIVQSVSPAEKLLSEKPPLDLEQEEGKLKQIKSPIVGTFYRASSPDAEALVEVGDKIETEQTVCIIEAMKVMNEIKSEMKGKIKEILVSNGEAVEFDQPLFLIDTDGTK